MTAIEVVTAAPMCTVQDAGRPNMLKHGVAASGPMDLAAYHRAAGLLGNAGSSCLEFGAGRMVLRVSGGPLKAAFCGGDFNLAIDGSDAGWECVVDLEENDEVVISPGTWGNFGLIRFNHEIGVQEILGSRATNLIAGIGGHEGRLLRAGDLLDFRKVAEERAQLRSVPAQDNTPLRVIWGAHADMFDTGTRRAFLDANFDISSKLDRMGMRLIDRQGVFAGLQHLSLVSDIVVAGDIQILGDGAPIVLMRDHQPTGGYPRIATVIGPDIDRLVQMRPGNAVRFTSVTVDKAHAILRTGGRR